MNPTGPRDPAQSSPPRVAVLGLGEAGSLFASGLASAGVPVVGWDPAGPRDPEVRGLAAESAAEAVQEADVVVSINTADVAESVASSVVARLRPEVLYADLNTAAPAVKRNIAHLVEPAGVLFADVALLSPAPRSGVATSAMVSGAGADRYAALLKGVDADVEVVPGGPGAAAGRKLLRSVFMKGLAAVVVEALEAARTAGCEPWLRDQLVSELEAADERLLTRLVEGSHQHAGRRVHEMRAAEDLLGELGAPARVTPATVGWLEQLAGETAAGSSR